jgi:hypothetical protein
MHSQGKLKEYLLKLPVSNVILSKFELVKLLYSQDLFYESSSHVLTIKVTV